MKHCYAILTMALFTSFESQSQTFQASNALKQNDKSKTIRELKPIDPLSSFAIATAQDSISYPSSSWPTQSLVQLQAEAGNAKNSVAGDDRLSGNIKKAYSESLTSIEENISEIKEFITKLNKAQTDKESQELTFKIEAAQKELAVTQLKISELNGKYENELSNSSSLKVQLGMLTNNLRQNEAELGSALKDISDFTKIIYRLRLKLNQPDLQGIFRIYSEMHSKYFEIMNTLDTLSWLTTKNLSDEDGDAIKNALKLLIGSSIIIDSAKKQEEIDSANFSKTLDSYKKLDIMFDTTYSASFNKLFKEWDRKLDTAYRHTARSLETLRKRMTEYTLKYNEISKDINGRLKKYQSKESGDQYYSIFGGFKKILEEEGSFIPEINVFAQKKFGQPTFGGYGQIRLFTGAGISNNNFNTKLNFFVPEASSYGIVTDFGLGFNLNTMDGKPSRNAQKKLKDFGVNTSFYVMGKNLKATDSLNIKPSVILWKTGLEILPFQNFFSLRANINGLFTANRSLDLKTYFPNSQQTYWFTDIAFSALLDIKETSNFKIKFDFNLIFLNEKTQAFLDTEDKILPQVKLELVTAF